MISRRRSAGVRPCFSKVAARFFIAAVGLIPSTALICVKRSLPITNLAEVRLFTSDFVRIAMFVDYHIWQLFPLKKIDDSTVSVAFDIKWHLNTLLEKSR
jgi:hypothetical protein